jgi:hypothetical protein
MHVSLRRTAAAVLSAALAVPALVTVAPTASAAPVTTITGLYGSTDPTYDGVYRQSLAILGLHAAGRSPRPEAVQWLLDQQCADGGFSSFKTTGPCPAFNPATFTGGTDSNATAMAAEALFAVGTPTAKAAAAKAAAYLKSVQLPDGSWEFNPGQSGSGDPDSTGLVLLALNAAGLTPTHAAAPYFASLQVGRTDFASHSPASDRGGISTSFAPGSPNGLATVQTVPGLRGAAFSRIPDLSGAWQDGATSYASLPAATAAGVAGWASSYLAGAVASAGATAYAAADPTVAAWTVLSFAADRTSETAARAVAAALEAQAASTSPAANGQDALVAAAVGHTAAAGVFADRIAASLTRDTAAPSTTWTASSTTVLAGLNVTLTRRTLSDAFWPARRLGLTIAWGDGTSQRVAAGTASVAHRYTSPGDHAVSVRVTDPSGNAAVRRVATITVRPDLVAPTARIAVPAASSSRSAWSRVLVSASDVGSGISTVRVRISQQRKGSWVSWNGSRWVAGTAAFVTATRVAPSRYVVATPALTLGRLVVVARATDRAGLSSPQSVASVTLRS